MTACLWVVGIILLAIAAGCRVAYLESKQMPSPIEIEVKTQCNSFEQWCVVEIMGHKKFAGLVTEQTIGGTSFVRIDVPELLSSDGDKVISERFTKLFGGGSIYCITPCTEETARAFAAGLRSEAFGLYDIPKITAPVRRSFVDDDDDGDFSDDLEKW